MTVQPIAEIGNRLAEQGRIRMGNKVATASGKGDRPNKLANFRFTSPDQSAIEALAVLYGGEARPWHDPKANPPNQWEVYSTAPKINVWLPGLDAVDTMYEQWAGGGCTRRCDGVNVQVAVQSGDGDYEMESAACICNAEGKLSCKPTTHLAVILPDLQPFGGIWRLTSRGWNAMQELTAMAQVVGVLFDSGKPIMATLGITDRQTQGGQKKFIVPTLQLQTTPQAMLEGGGAAPVLGVVPEYGQLPAGPSPAESARAVKDEHFGGAHYHGDDQVVDAEIVEDFLDDPAADGSWGATMASLDWAQRLLLSAGDIVEGLCRFVSNGRLTTVDALDDEQRAKMQRAISALHEGTATVDGVTQAGTLKVRKLE
jgi:hypothetical protein